MSRGQLVAFPPSSESRSGQSRAMDDIFARRRNLERALGRNGGPDEAAAGGQGRRRHQGGEQGRSSVSALTLTLILAALLGVGLFCRNGSVAELPSAERARVYAQTLTVLQTACIPARSWSPSDYCREQIQTVLEFPECGAECHALVQQAGHRPTK